MAFALAIFLVRILNRDFLVDKILAVHACNSVVGRFKVGKGDEAVALGKVIFVTRNLQFEHRQPILSASSIYTTTKGGYQINSFSSRTNLWNRHQAAESAERIKQRLLIHHRIEISDE